MRHALGILSGEVDRVLGQLGCTSLADLGPHRPASVPCPETQEINSVGRVAMACRLSSSGRRSRRRDC
ncbi:MAG: alpha-hydroxy-acid oxidizing protein [Candidatus Moduliflexus flocculans]|nr:alpha-hydroxy-acid oxidizing protein [Candidatus Moduliflexus flocculans]